MSAFTAEISWLVPSGLHIIIEADNPAAALAEANRMINAGEVDFDRQREWGDASSATEVTGVWAGTQCYTGADLRTPAEVFAADLARARELAPLAVETMVNALNEAERFISGFEGDELQDGIPELLATIRAAIGGAAHAVSQAPADAYLERFPADQRATANRTYQDGFVDGAESERGTWQDISTAPTNGDHILIARMPDQEPSMPEGVIAHWAHSKHGWGWYANGIGFITDTGIYVPGNGMVSDNGWEDLRPTHWLALPEADAA